MIFSATRYFLIGVLLVLNIAILVLSSSVFVVSNADNVYRPIYVYLIFLSAFSCVFLLPIALIDLTRKGAVPSRVLFELGWLVLFWLMHLAGASALTAAPPCAVSASCHAAQRTLLIFSWLAVSDLLVHLAALLLLALLHVNDVPDVWSMGFRDIPWFTSRQDKSEGITPYTQGRPNAGDAQGHQQSEQPQPRSSQSHPWHGRRRSHAHSWRDRYPSQSFSSQDRENQHPPADGDLSDPARAFYPFLGQGPNVTETRREHEETMLQPLPVAFTFERTRPPSQQPAQPVAQTQSRSRRETNGYSSNGPAEQPQSRRLLPDPPEPPKQPQSRPALPPLPPPRSSRRTSRRPSSREEPQLVPLDISRTQSQRQQQRTSSSAPRELPADSLLFSPPLPSSQQPQERPRRGPPPPTTRLLPNTTAFYGTAVQSVLRSQEEEVETTLASETGEDRRSPRRVYASAPQRKPMSEAQAYAAEAMRRPSTTTSERGRR